MTFADVDLRRAQRSVDRARRAGPLFRRGAWTRPDAQTLVELARAARRGRDPQRDRSALQPADLRRRVRGALHLPRHGDDAVGAASASGPTRCRASSSATRSSRRTSGGATRACSRCVGMGVEPGLSDVFARYAADHLFSSIDEIGVRDGANLVVEGYAFAPTFSIWTTIEECLNPPLVWERDRGWFTTEPFSEPEVFDFPEGIGPVECVNVEHEEVVLIPREVDCRARDVQVRPRRRVHRGAAHAAPASGSTRRKPVRVGDVEVAPRDVVAAALPDPATLGDRMTGKTCAGTFVTGTGNDGDRAERLPVPRRRQRGDDARVRLRRPSSGRPRSTRCSRSSCSATGRGRARACSARRRSTRRRSSSAWRRRVGTRNGREEHSRCRLRRRWPRTSASAQAAARALRRARRRDDAARRRARRGRARLGRRRTRVRRLRRRARLPEHRPRVRGARRSTSRSTAICTSASWSGCTSRTSRSAGCSTRSGPARARRSSLLVNSGAEGGRERGQDRARRDRPARGDRVRPRVPRPHEPDDGDDGEGRSYKRRLRPARARGLPRAGAVPATAASRPTTRIAGLRHLFKQDVEPERVACVVLEPVQGEGGFVPCPTTSRARLREICDRARHPLRRRRGAGRRAAAPARCGRSSTTASSPTCSCAGSRSAAGCRSPASPAGPS